MGIDAPRPPPRRGHHLRSHPHGDAAISPRGHGEVGRAGASTGAQSQGEWTRRRVVTGGAAAIDDWFFSLNRNLVLSPLFGSTGY